MLGTRIPPPLLMLVMAIAIAAAGQLPPQLPLPSLWRHLVAGLLLVAGLGVTALGVQRFRAARTTIDPTRPDKATTLVATGIYRVTRNPMYLGFATMLMGWAVQWQSVWCMAFPVMFVGYINRYQIAPEESALRTKFGAEFDAYASKVRRWL